MATFCPLCPLSYPKAATEKPSIYAGLRGLWPLCPPFSLFNCDKKIKKYKEVCKKPGQSGHLRIRKTFLRVLGGDFMLFMFHVLFGIMGYLVVVTLLCDFFSVRIKDAKTLDAVLLLLTFPILFVVSVSITMYESVKRIFRTE